MDKKIEIIGWVEGESSKEFQGIESAVKWIEQKSGEKVEVFVEPTDFGEFEYAVWKDGRMVGSVEKVYEA